MVIDVIYEDGTFLWKMRDAGEITQRCFSYIVTDGTDLYLSNGADWDAGERYGDKRVFLVPPMAGEEWVSDVESMEADRLAENTARYSLWSDDGVWNVRLTEEPTVFSVSWQKQGEGAWGKRLRPSGLGRHRDRHHRDPVAGRRHAASDMRDGRRWSQQGAL